jgi:thiamine biosynthesis protein ThiS
MQPVEIFVNGERLQVPLGCNVAEMLDHLKIAPDRVAVELNKMLVRKRDWAATSVQGGAHVEVVEFVGGG